LKRALNAPAQFAEAMNPGRLDYKAARIADPSAE
jgi:hypothetical protein